MKPSIIITLVMVLLSVMSTESCSKSKNTNELKEYIIKKIDTECHIDEGELVKEYILRDVETKELVHKCILASEEWNVGDTITTKL